MDLFQKMYEAKFNVSNMRINMKTNTSVLTKEEWKMMDTEMVTGARPVLKAAADLTAKANKSLGGKGMAVTTFEWQEATQLEGAELSMDGLSKGNNDRNTFALKGLPIPIIHKDFSINARALIIARNNGRMVDVSQAFEAGQCCAEKLEDMVINGTSDFTFGGNTIYGYTDFPDRITSTLGSNWFTKTPVQILDQVRGELQKLRDANANGPYTVYIPTQYEEIMDKKYSDTYESKTLRQEIMQLGGIAEIKSLDYLANNNVLILQFSPKYMRMIDGMNLTNIHWDIQGGMATDFKTMMIKVPNMRSDADGNCGILHLS